VAVPKKKTSKSRRDMRRSQHDRISAPAVSECPQCGAPTMPHHACPGCGTYRGRQVIELATETTAKKEG
jgi:large subunit ribosomal protein L32